MKEKERIEEIKKLAKQKKYEEIYFTYGPKYFRKYVSRKYRKKDIKKLRNEERYLDIYQKYGKEADMIDYQLDIINELGIKATTIRQLILNKPTIKEVFKIFMIYTFSMLGFSSFTDNTPILINRIHYQKEFNNYKSELKNKAQKFNREKQSDLEIIMTVLKEFQDGIQGYGKPKIDLLGIRGIDVMEDGIGVCRNMTTY